MLTLTSLPVSDLSFLSKHAARNAQFVFLGDWNVDQLPALSIDPFASLPSRSIHHYDRRILLASWADSIGAEMHLPTCSLSFHGGEYDDLCLSCCPLTRLPIGLQVALPSCLDYSFDTQQLIEDSYLEWHGVPADHALYVCVCNPIFRLPVRHKNTWLPVCEDHAMSCFADIPLSNDTEVADLVDRLSCVQAHCRDTRTCKERRYDRMPQDLRDVYRSVVCARDVCEAQRLRKLAWTKRRTWMADIRLQSRLKMASEGRVFCKAKKLHRIKKLYASPTCVEVCTDPVTHCRQ